MAVSSASLVIGCRHTTIARRQPATQLHAGLMPADKRRTLPAVMEKRDEPTGMNEPGKGDDGRKGLKIGFSLAALLFAALAFSGFADRVGLDYTDQAFGRALATFGIARGLNAVISVVQGTEISLSPIGMGLHLTPGQLLDPVNDLIERFSMVMLLSSASLGVQKVLLSISASVLFSIVLAAVLLLSVLRLWKPGAVAALPQDWLYRVAVLLVVARFAVPLAAIGSDLVYRAFLSDQYQESSLALERTGEKISEMQSEDAAQGGESGNWVDALKGFGRSIDLDQRMQKYKVVAAEASEETINLIVVFLMQTVLLPLLFLWLLVRLLRGLWR